ncbi:MAG: hypothetical protein ABIP06_07870 [Pyrinomonadaceae bacterium]
MECCQEFNETEIKPQSIQYLRIIFGLLVLSFGVWFAAQTGLKGHGLGYVMILAAPFTFMD